MVGNDFVRGGPRLRLAAPAAAVEVPAPLPIPVISRPEDMSVSVQRPPKRRALSPAVDVLHRHSLATFALLFLLVGSSGILVGARYWASRLEQAIPIAATAKKPTITGLSLTVPVNQLQPKLQIISGQAASLAVGDQTVPISPDTIKSWLQISTNPGHSEAYIYIKKDAMSKSLRELANQFVKAPVDQVTANHSGVDQVIVAGRNGTSLSNLADLAAQAQAAAKTVLDAKGLHFSTPITTKAFQSVTPAAFSKLLEADVTNKTLYVYQDGQLINTFLTSDGAPATPTPLGEFHIYAKYTVQDMSGYNPNGTKYFQPRVPWVNYFTGGDAIHGVYWHPISWFGVHNSSHGCVGVPVDVGEWIYNWAPIGTTVITHA